MVAKNTTGDASASGDQIATDPSRHGRVPDSPLDYFGIEDEVVRHPNRLLEERDELEDMRTPDTVYDWLVRHGFPDRFACDIKQGRFDGPGVLELFGSTCTIQEAVALFREYGLAVPTLLPIWGRARAYFQEKERTGAIRGPTSAEAISKRDQDASAQPSVRQEQHLGGTENDATSPGAGFAMDDNTGGPGVTAMAVGDGETFNTVNRSSGEADEPAAGKQATEIRSGPGTYHARPGAGFAMDDNTRGSGVTAMAVGDGEHRDAVNRNSREADEPTARNEIRYGLEPYRTEFADDIGARRTSQEKTDEVSPPVSIAAGRSKAIDSRPNRGDTRGIVSTPSSCQTPVGPAGPMAVSPVSLVSPNSPEAHSGGTDGAHDELEWRIALYKTFRVETAPKIRFDEQNMWRLSAWSRHANTQVDWVSVRSRELGSALQKLFEDPLRTDVNRVQRALSEDAKQKDLLLGAHLSSTASDQVMDRLDQEDNRRIDGTPSSLKIYHHLLTVVLSDLDDLKDEMVNDLLDQEGRWQPVTDPGKLLHELELMDKAVRDLKMAGSFDDQHIGLVWKTALNGLISTLEDDTNVWAVFGSRVSNFKRCNEGYAGSNLRAELQEPAQQLFAKYRRKYLLPRYEASDINEYQGENHEEYHNAQRAGIGERQRDDHNNQDEFTTRYGGENHQQIDREQESNSRPRDPNGQMERPMWPMTVEAANQHVKTRVSEESKNRREIADRLLKSCLKNSPRAKPRRHAMEEPSYMMTMKPHM